MTNTEVSREFDYVRTLLDHGDTVDDVYHGGKAPLNGGGWAAACPKGRNIGRIWHRVTDGDWLATPETSVNWTDIAWYGSFRSRAEAAMFLVAMATPRPRYCPSCRRPVIVGDAPIRSLFNRDWSEHACA